ncbi:MAG TPA: hypothetical protein PK791_01635 [Anaerolineaceae bacterium]|jgi:hypothetical protein|nr:hypothetical protein [Anaerolineaceae bacterium]HNZ14703.1 hypothetical protein [Anaerolineaceae bacterium]HOH92045.1 hypothetical protein [Anaerolineaceae bacterium]HQL92082.1 hypothetical protein [Anaerolineaceae bacterium]HQN68452.1 hypothetical protein [Anaerolineaceae bacterium]
MSILTWIFGEEAIRRLPAQQKAEIRQKIDQLVHIGKTDDFLSLVPGGPFNYQCHHREARTIGEEINAMGGLALMMAVRQTIKRKLSDVMAEHLDHAWKGIGDWQP